MENKINPKNKLSLVSIQAAEDLGRLNKNLESELNSAKKLSKIIKEDFHNKFSYSSVFSDAYFVTYDKRVPPMLKGSPKNYHKEIYEKLENPKNLNKKDLNDLINFCVNLSDFSAMYEKELRDRHSGSCF